MSIFHAIQLKDFSELFSKLQLQKEHNTFEKIEFCDRGIGGRDETCLWKVLSHPHCRVHSIAIVQHKGLDVTATSTAMKAVKRWCKDVPTPHLRRLQFTLNDCNTKVTKDVFNHLIEALKQPNNRVAELSFRLSYQGLPVCGLALRPILQNPNNALVSLTLDEIGQMNEVEAKALAEGLASPNCKLKEFKLVASMDGDSKLGILTSLYRADNIERLVWQSSHREGEDATPHAARFARMLNRPSGSKLRTLELSVDGWCLKDFYILARVLKSVHCTLEELELCDIRRLVDASRPLADALCHPGNRIRKLNIPTWDESTILEDCLKNANCKLESITIGSAKCILESRQSMSVIAIAKALGSSSNCLNTLEIWAETVSREQTFRAFIASLRSNTNKLSFLRLKGCNWLDPSTRNEFYRSIRVSNVRVLRCHQDRFVNAFNAPFFQVLITLSAVKHVPRLGASAWVRLLLPIRDIVLWIARTLQWPLDDLRV